MATNYPGGLDSFTAPDSSAALGEVVGGRKHSERHRDVEDAVEAIQAELGVNPSGASATVVARLDALAAGSGHEVWDRFSDHANGALGAALTGQVYANFGTPVGTGGVGPAVSAGKLGRTYTGAGAWYAQQRLAGNVRRIGARFSVEPGSSTLLGAAVFGVWNNDFAVTNPTIPSGPLHFVMRRDGWSIGVIEAGVVSEYAGAYYSFTLADDGTVYSAEAVIDADNGTVTIYLPDGSVAAVQDSRVSTLDAEWAMWEGFTSAATDPVFKFHEVWADSRSADSGIRSALAAQTATLAVERPVVVEYAPATDPNHVAPTSPTAVDTTNLRLTATFPASGRILIEASGYVEFLSACSYYWSVMRGGTIVVADLAASAPGAAGIARFAGARVITGPPGDVYVLDLAHFATASSAAVLHSSHGAGLPTLLKATPLPA